MDIYVVVSNYFENHVYGIYSTIKRARMSLEYYFKWDENIVSFEDTGDYGYQIVISNGTTFDVKIYQSILDYESEMGIIEEDK